MANTNNIASVNGNAMTAYGHHVFDCRAGIEGQSQSMDAIEDTDLADVLGEIEGLVEQVSVCCLVPSFQGSVPLSCPCNGTIMQTKGSFCAQLIPPGSWCSVLNRNGTCWALCYGLSAKEATGCTSRMDEAVASCRPMFGGNTGCGVSSVSRGRGNQVIVVFGYHNNFVMEPCCLGYLS